jgi:hypothetical protein
VRAQASLCEFRFDPLYLTLSNGRSGHELHCEPKAIRDKLASPSPALGFAGATSPALNDARERAGTLTAAFLLSSGFAGTALLPSARSSHTTLKRTSMSAGWIDSMAT